MSERFFSEIPISGNRLSLTGAEARHLTQVMRARVGDPLTVFDGCGAEYSATITDIHRKQVDLCVLQRCDVDRELPFGVTLGVALPKGDRQRWLIEKCVELGVRELVPLVTERSVAQPTETARQRLYRAVVEASKQSGRNRLMSIAPAAGVAEFLRKPPATAGRYVAQPGSSVRCRLARRGGRNDYFFAIGPEGGFTPGEIGLAQDLGWELLDLGPRTLRVETAAAVVAALCLLLSVEP